MADSLSRRFDAESAELTPIKVEVAQVRHRIIAALRRAIEMGTLRAGERLVEKDLCTRLGVSRTSLREALRDLEAHGVVTKISPRQLVIASLTREDVINLYGLRGAVETLIAEQFIARAPAQAVADLRGVLLRIQQTDLASMASLDAQRHYYDLLCRAAENPLALEMLSNIQLRLSVIRGEKHRKPNLMRQNVAEKSAIVDCLECRDLDAARAAVRTHIQHGIDTALEELDGSLAL